MKTDIKFNEDAINRIASGVSKLARTVGSTLGPGGCNVIYSFGVPKVTKDGVTVAQSVMLPDKWENIGAQMVKQAARQTCQDAGDGTTTATVLSDAILKHGIKTILNRMNPINVVRGIDKGVDFVIDYIEKNMRHEVAEKEELRKVALLSSNWDEEIGNLVFEAVWEVGEQGGIEIEDAKGAESSIRFTNGIKFDRGFINPALAQDQSAMRTDFINPRILLCKDEFNYVNDFIPLLNIARKNNESIVIVADSFGNDFLSMLVMNKLKVTCLKAPHYRDMRLNTMQDLAVLFGTEYYDFAHGDVSVRELELDDLGMCSRFIQTPTSSTFVGGNGDAEEIKHLSEEIKKLSEDMEVDVLHRENAKLRLKQINSKTATIYVGSSSEIENDEKRDRFDDAIHAVRAALREGIVPGGSVCYLKAVQSSDFDEFERIITNPDESAGLFIVRKALTVPFNLLMSNAGLEDRIYEVMTDIRESKNPDVGFNIKTKQISNLIEDGVIDPWTVTKQALRNAASVAGMILSSSAAIALSDED